MTTDRTTPPLSVLVVDDDEDGCESLAVLLRLYGHRVAVARTGTAALDQAARDVPDAVLLDLRLPDVDGWEVARRLRAGARADGGKRPFLVAVTGCTAPADLDRSAAVGFDLHLLKPVEPGLVVGLLDRFRRVLAPPARDPHVRPTGTSEGGV